MRTIILKEQKLLVDTGNAVLQKTFNFSGPSMCEGFQSCNPTVLEFLKNSTMTEHFFHNFFVLRTIEIIITHAQMKLYRIGYAIKDQSISTSDVQ